MCSWHFPIFLDEDIRIYQSFHIKIFQIITMNLRTLGDMKKQSGQDDDKKKTTSSYTGGESSGMAVINPDVHGLMQKAQKNSKTPDEFAKEEKSKNGSVCKITLYQNGFMIDDDEQFNDYNDPENKKFMQELNNGLIPKALKKRYPQGGLSVSLSDKTEEKYTPPPPPPYVAFSGSGVSLSEPSKKPGTFGKKKGHQENFILEPDRRRDVTTMQVRLSDGQRITVEANLDTNLQDVYNHIATVSGISHFDLFGGFPPKPLDLHSTVEKSDLADSTLIQKV